MTPVRFATAAAATDGVRTRPSMSSDGRHVAWLAGDGPARLVLLDVADRAVCARLTVPAVRCRGFTWSYLPGVGLLTGDRTGTEDWSVYRLDAGTGAWTPVVDQPGSQARVAGLSAQRPGEVLIATNGRDPRHHDYDVVSLRTGQRTRVAANAGYAAVYFDERFRPRLVETVAADGARELWHGDPARGRRFLTVPHEHALCVRVVGFSADSSRAWLVLPDGPAGMRLVGLRCTDGAPASEAETVITVHRADIPRVHRAPGSGRPDLVEVERYRPRCVALDPGLAAPLRALRRRLGGEPSILERRLGDRYWLVTGSRAGSAGRSFLYQPAPDELWPLEQDGPGQASPAVTSGAVSLRLRGGARAVTYLDRPRRSGTALGDPPPAVLVVHGGPWRRSHAGDERRARLAAQGYCVIEPNFRGSTGFGADWVNAGDRQWGAALQEDLEDTLDWVTSRGHADPARIAVVGGSYGGYAALQLAATSRVPVRCVVATSAVTDLVAFVTGLPAPWQTAAPMVRRRVGDPDVPAQRRALAARSPLHHAAALRCPVLLVHGLNDSRVTAEMSTRMFMALARAGRDATVALFRGEGHEIAGTANRRALQVLTAGFLARHLGGAERAEPLPQAATVTLRHTPRAARGPARVPSPEALPC